MTMAITSRPPALSSLPVVVPPRSVREKQATKNEAVKPARVLRQLATCTVLPDKYSEHSQVLTALKHLDAVEVLDSVKRNGHRFYVVGVWFKMSQSRIPTYRASLHRAGERPPASALPDLHLDRRFSDFANLREELYFHCRASHAVSSCAFCDRIVQYIVLGPAQPGVIAKVVNSERTICKMLQYFLNDILNLALRAQAYPAGQTSCRGQEIVPALVKRFIMPESVHDDVVEIIGGRISYEPREELLSERSSVAIPTVWRRSR